MEYYNQRYRLQDQIEIQIPARQVRLEQKIQKLTADVSTVSSHTINGFIMAVNGKAYIKREEAGTALIELSRSVEPEGVVTAGEYRGLTMELVHERAIIQFLSV